MFLHNEIGNDSIKQKNIFNQIFVKNDNFHILDKIINQILIIVLL